MRYPYDWRVSAAMWRIEEMWTRTVGQFARRIPNTPAHVPSAHSAGCVHEARYTAAEMNVLRNGGEPARWPRQRIAPPCTEDITVRATVTRNAQQELPGSWPGRTDGMGCVRYAQTHPCVRGRQGSHSRRQRSSSTRGCGFARSACRSVPQQGGQSDASLPCVGLIGWNR